MPVECEAVECRHDWETCEAWGVVYGVCRCKKCGKVASKSDFDQPDSKEAKP